MLLDTDGWRVFPDVARTFQMKPQQSKTKYQSLLQNVTLNWNETGTVTKGRSAKYCEYMVSVCGNAIAAGVHCVGRYVFPVCRRTGECTEIIDGLPFCEQNAVLERLKIDVTVGTDGTCSDWSFQDSPTNKVRLMEEWCASAGAHHNAG